MAGAYSGRPALPERPSPKSDSETSMLGNVFDRVSVAPLTFVLCLALHAGAACAGDGSPSSPIDDRDSDSTAAQDTLPIPLAGGATTLFDATQDAYHLPAPNLAGARLQRHLAGQIGFRSAFDPAPGQVNFGLGPLFNDVACEACHVRGSRTRGVRLLRVSVEGVDTQGAPNPVPGFGTQIQDRAIIEFEPEANVDVQWTTVQGAFADGSPYSLRRPVPVITRTYAAFGASASSLRAPRPLFGMGLLEAVPDATLEFMADPGDSNGDGISGRVNRVWDIASESLVVGRFGWKAGQPSLRQQTDAAYVEDMGVTSSLFPQEATAGQVGGSDGLDDDPEIPDAQVEGVLFYLRTLGVPARRDVNDAQVREGESLFNLLGCAGCHVPSLVSGDLEGVAEVSGQVFFSYTDLLLHDMGDGLDDNRPVFAADGGEWRTPPLWGLGLADVVAAQTEYLHDGRARSVEEAILWHGGEAEAARGGFVALGASARATLLRFLASL